ncbi:hypothetical protein BHM03_00023329 [Ensete ventricosum]|nr:hypothetical protein BHM03_00023329 [Ensete ventricosum]
MHHNPIRRLQTTKPVTLVIRNVRLKDTFSNRKKWRGGIRSPPTVNLPCWSSRKGPPSRPHPSTGFDLPSVFHRFIQDRKAIQPPCSLFDGLEIIHPLNSMQEEQWRREDDGG